MPFFEFIEPPSFREPVIPKDILPRDVASMPEVQLREYFRAKGLSNKDIEVIFSTRSSYRYNELSVMTNYSEIVASLSSLSPAELKSIVQAEIKLAKATGDYSGLDAQYIEVAAKMSKGEIKYSESKVIELKQKAELEAKLQEAKIEAIVREAKVVSRDQFLKNIAEGGEINITFDGENYRHDINGKTFKESIQIVSEINGIDIKTLEEVYLNHETIKIGEFEFKLDGEETGVVEPNLTPEQKAKLAEEKKINVVNYTIYKSSKLYGKFSVHDAGHSRMTSDKNATLPHLNYKIYSGGKAIDGHIFYKLKN